MRFRDNWVGFSMAVLAPACRMEVLISMDPPFILGTPSHHTNTHNVQIASAYTTRPHMVPFTLIEEDFRNLVMD